MEKYLFINGSNGIKELHSTEELESHIRAVQDPAAIRIWPFGGKEWLTLTQYRRFQSPLKRVTEVTPTPASKPVGPSRSLIKWAGRAVFGAVLVAAAIIIYNFTRISWHPAEAVAIPAVRPANVPSINVDSLIAVVESSRGGKLDRVTRTNLRIRNTWPDRILLSFRAHRDTMPGATRFKNRSITIDNATGYFINNVSVRVDTWGEGLVLSTDTLSITGIDYTEPVIRELDGIAEGDSVSVSFVSIQAPVFNFCYSSDKQSNYGNLNDRWFCKD